MIYQRPTSYLVFAILNLIFGIGGMLCAFGGLLESPVEINQQDLTKQFAAHMKTEAAGYDLYLYGSVFAGVILGAALAVSGIGLLQTANWGRVLAILVCSLSALITFAQIAYTLVVLVPVVKDFFDKNAPPQELGNVGLIFEITMYAAVAFSALFALFYIVEIIILAQVGPPRPMVEEEALN